MGFWDRRRNRRRLAESLRRPGAHLERKLGMGLAMWTYAARRKLSEVMFIIGE
jgi:hypothetical protein